MFPTLETTLGGLYLLILNILFMTGIVATWGYKRLVRENKNNV